ncbi:GGDEF domain-containing protein [Bordetella pertussis]
MRKIEALAMWIATLIRVHRQVERLTHLSRTDPLTQIMNRRAFTESFQTRRLEGERRRAEVGTGLGFAVVDIDHFKQINDTYGHDVGDVVLAFVGKMMNEFFRESDCVARFGGEEFCVLMQDVDEGACNGCSSDFELPWAIVSLPTRPEPCRSRRALAPCW